MTDGDFMITYRNLEAQEITLPLFDAFQRRQIVRKCWRREAKLWVIRDAPFIDEWSPEDYALLVKCLQNTVNSGGIVYGAFFEQMLKGFVSVEPQLFGGNHKYMDLTSIHVSADMRGAGIGRTLFRMAMAWAREHGAKKLYISAHSAVETQAFYRAMGCTEAAVYQQAHIESEPFDCQLECNLEDERSK